MTDTSTKAALEMVELLDDEEHQWHYEAADLIRALVAERNKLLVECANLRMTLPARAAQEKKP